MPAAKAAVVIRRDILSMLSPQSMERNWAAPCRISKDVDYLFRLPFRANNITDLHSANFNFEDIEEI